jgi:hypothetical protein
MKQREGEGERRTAAMTSLSGEVRREEREEDIRVRERKGGEGGEWRGEREREKRTAAVVSLSVEVREERGQDGGVRGRRGRRMEGRGEQLPSLVWER